MAVQYSHHSGTTAWYSANLRVGCPTRVLWVSQTEYQFWSSSINVLLRLSITTICEPVILLFIFFVTVMLSVPFVELFNPYAPQSEVLSGAVGFMCGWLANRCSFSISAGVSRIALKPCTDPSVLVLLEPFFGVPQSFVSCKRCVP